MKYSIVLALLLLYNCSFSQRSIEFCEVLIEVKSNETGKPIKSAWVELKGHVWNETDKDGKVFFEKVVKGNYTIAVNANGYEPYTHPFLFKVTGDDDNLEIYLNPLPPDNTFSISGRVIDMQSESPLDSVEVFVKIGLFDKTIYTNDWGFYNFLCKEDEVKGNSEFSLNVRKKGYELKSYKSGFYSNHIEAPIFKLERAKDEKVKIPELGAKDLSIIPLMAIGISPEANFFLSNNDLQVQLATSFAIRWNIYCKRKVLSIGTGWHLPLDVNTQNTFETLNGQVSQVETKYRIDNLGFLNLRYFTKNGKANYKPFFDFMVLVEKQTPTPPVVISGYHQVQKESYIKCVPRITGGISIARGLFWIEPFVSATYFNMNSQNFTFNYFGRADSISVKESFFQTCVGLNVALTIIKSKR